VFSFGNAPFLGSVPGVLGPRAEHLNKPVVGIAADPSGNGYWLAAADGGVFAFGNAPFEGSLGATRIDTTIVSIMAKSSDSYVLTGANGTTWLCSGGTCTEQS